MKDAERFDKLQEIASKIKSDEPLDIADISRRLLVEGSLNQYENGKSIGNIYGWLFNDKILLAKPQRNLVGEAKYKLIMEMYENVFPSLPKKKTQISNLAQLSINDVDASAVANDTTSFDSSSSATDSMFDIIKISKSQYVQNTVFRVDAGTDACMFFFFFFSFLPLWS